jgi:hypothetical protein
MRPLSLVGHCATQQVPVGVELRGHEVGDDDSDLTESAGGTIGQHLIGQGRTGPWERVALPCEWVSCDGSPW